MSDFGMSSEGFNRKRLPDILSDLNAEQKSIFGSNFNTNPESPDGQINGVISESQANLWEISEEAYNTFNPKAATGSTLSNLVQLNGIVRLSATNSTTTLAITGTAATLIPAGSLVSTSDTGEVFSTDVDLILDGGGVGNVAATAVPTGPISALAATLTVIDTPLSGWATVTNTLDAVEGTNLETDVDLRARREVSVAKASQAIVDGMFAGISNVPGVTSVVVLENDTNAVDVNGLPAHSTEAIVVGGDDNLIAAVIFNKKAAGITTFGDTTISVDDDQGIGHDINFQRPTEINIFVEVTVTTNGDYPATGDEDIKQAIVDYANGELVAGREFTVGDDVIFTRLYTPINSVQGHQIDDLQIGLVAPASGTSNLPISITEISNFTTSNIVVNS